jgi:hypothetical protein
MLYYLFCSLKNCHLATKNMGMGPEIQDPEKTIPDPGVKKAPDPGSESATLINFFQL